MSFQFPANGFVVLEVKLSIGVLPPSPETSGRHASSLSFGPTKVGVDVLTVVSGMGGMVRMLKPATAGISDTCQCDQAILVLWDGKECELSEN